MPLSVRELLKEHSIEASAPCRIDSGGTWDIKAMALPLEGIEPTTVNIALNLRTRVLLSPYKKGWVGVSSEGFSRTQGFPFSDLPFNKAFGLFFAAVAHFGFHGLQIHIRSESPIKSALGGSSTALIALLKALSRLSVLLGGRGLSAKGILSLGYHLEDGISGGYCGIQDQASAVYGGVNRWRWTYNNPASPFRREPLLDTMGQRELSEHLLVAYSGQSHVSARINRSWINDFLSGKTRSGWIKANHMVLKLAQAIKGKDWTLAAGLLREEMSIRKEITPNALIPVTEELITQAEGLGCGARFAGAGAGGSVWALGEMDKIVKLKELWNTTLALHKRAFLLNCAVDPTGVR